MKKLIVLSARPGSGKSTWARKYAETHPNTYIISSDDIRYEITGQYQDFSKQKEVWQTFEDRIIEYAKMDDDFTVILDCLCDLNDLRMKYYRLGKDYDRKILVVIKKSHDEIFKFNKERRKEEWVPDDVLEDLYNKFEEPNDEVLETYDAYVLIDKYFY